MMSLGKTHCCLLGEKINSFERNVHLFKNYKVVSQQSNAIIISISIISSISISIRIIAVAAAARKASLILHVIHSASNDFLISGE